jgi:hypothetical protein
LKEVRAVIEECLPEVFELSLTTKKHPGKWKEAVCAIIPKPGKGKYDTTRSYRPISLLNTMGKCLKKVIGNRISKVVEGNQGLHRMQ